MLAFGSIELTEKEMLEMLRSGETEQKIASYFNVTSFLLHHAVEYSLKGVIEWFEKNRGINFNARNAMGETILHTLAETGNLKCIQKLAIWVREGRINVKALTDTRCNFLHYISHVRDHEVLKQCFLLADEKLLMTPNQIGYTPLRLAIDQDNDNFLVLAMDHFQIEIQSSYLLHDIIQAEAVNCLAVLQNRLGDKACSDLQGCLINVAKMAGKRTFVEMFKGYRSQTGLSSLQWLSAKASVSDKKRDELAECPWLLEEILNDAFDEKLVQAQDNAARNNPLIDSDDCILSEDSDSSDDVESPKLRFT